MKRIIHASIWTCCAVLSLSIGCASSNPDNHLIGVDNDVSAVHSQTPKRQEQNPTRGVAPPVTRTPRAVTIPTDKEPSITTQPMQPSMPGERVIGSTLSVPPHVRAGEVLQGQVPSGSQVDIDGKGVAVDANGKFRYVVHTTASGKLTVRVKRPAPDQRPTMTFYVQIRN